MGFHSNIFLVPKKSGELRPVINLKALNQFVHPEYFKMEGIHTLRDLLWPGDWLAKIDLKNAYLAIPIHQTHRDYLRFHALGMTYHFTCLPFGLSSASWVFTKTLKPALALLRAIGVRLIVYIDDILILADSKELLLNHLEGLCYLLECLYRVHHQQGEISDETRSCHRVSWPHSQLNQYGAESPTTENKTNSSRGSETNEGEKHFSPQPHTAVGENEFNSMCDSSSSPLLSPLTDDSIQHIGEEQPKLRGYDNPTNRMPRRAGLVEHPHVQVEWQDSSKERDRPDH